MLIECRQRNKWRRQLCAYNSWLLVKIWKLSDREQTEVGLVPIPGADLVLGLYTHQH